MEDYHVCKWNGRNSTQIPVFGDWDRTNELPITQYFQCARKAGLIRFRSSSSEEVPHVPAGLFAADLKRVVRSSPPTPLKTRERGMRNQMEKKQRQPQQRKVCEATKPARKTESNDTVPTRPAPKARAPKLDEDLYKIPPKLLHSSKRNKMVDFLSRCWVPLQKLWKNSTFADTEGPEWWGERLDRPTVLDPQTMD